MIILLKTEQKSETIIEFKNEKSILPFCIAFSSFRNFFVKATIKKSIKISTEIRSEYMIRFFQTTVLLEPIFPKRISEGSGAGEMSNLDFRPYNN